jgi:hypothetical protein
MATAKPSAAASLPSLGLRVDTEVNEIGAAQLQRLARS